MKLTTGFALESTYVRNVPKTKQPVLYGPPCRSVQVPKGSPHSLLAEAVGQQPQKLSIRGSKLIGASPPVGGQVEAQLLQIKVIQTQEESRTVRALEWAQENRFQHRYCHSGA